jgi:hypothetical protein
VEILSIYYALRPTGDRGRIVGNWEVTPFFAHCHVGW